MIPDSVPRANRPRTNMPSQRVRRMNEVLGNTSKSMHRVISSSRWGMALLGLIWPRYGLLKPLNVGGVAKQNNPLNTYTPNAYGGGGKDGSSLGVCVQKELAGKAGLRKKG